MTVFRSATPVPRGWLSVVPTSLLPEASAVEIVDQRGLLAEQPLAIAGRKRRKGVDQDPLARNVNHVAREDPAPGAPCQPDAALETGGLGRMEAVLV